MKKRHKYIILIISIFLFISLLCALLVYNGIILLNNPSEKKYPVRGVDVSHYQGEIDWELLASQNIDFAFIKATEGSSFVDPKFQYNFSEAQKQTLAVGAYHFFSFDSKGASQAQHFINTVPPFDGMLPPVIDLEFYGDKQENPPNCEDVEMELKTLLTDLEEFYGLKPIIYCTKETYDLYIANDYSDYDIWIRDVYARPTLCDNRDWTFWQFTNREKLSGYDGAEKFIDVNVFNGSEQDFLEYPTYKGKKE